MDFFEKNLEDLIWEAYQTSQGRVQLRNCGLPIQGKLFRQLKLGTYGIADLVSIHFDRDQKNNRVIRITVYELKKKTLTYKAFGQAGRYLAGIADILSNHFEEIAKNNIVDLKAVVIGSGWDEDTDMGFLYNLCSGHFSMYFYKYGVNGLNFQEIPKTFRFVEPVLPSIPRDTYLLRSIIKHQD